MSWGSGWRRRVVIGGTLAVLGAVVALPGTFASGAGGTLNTFGSAGVLRLHLGSQDYFRFDPSSGAPTQTNIVPGAGCKVSLANGSLVSTAVTGTGAALGLVADGLGVQTKIPNEGNGTSCGQVNGTSQTMTMALAGSLAGKAIDLAELDIEGKFNVKVRADLFLGSASAGTRFLATGTASDSGPDSGDGDNYRFEITDALFDKIKLSVDPSTPSGAFSLEGGADGTTPGPVGATLAADKNDSIFRISGAEGVLDCGQTVTESGASGEPDASVTRLSNNGCEKILYDLDSTSDGDSQDVSFVKDISAQPTASFFVTIDWEPEVGQYPLPGTLVDEQTGADPYTPDWCDGTFDNPSLSATSAAAGQHWCVRRETADSAGIDSIHRITNYFGVGDPIFQLPKLLG